MHKNRAIKDWQLNEWLQFLATLGKIGITMLFTLYDIILSLPIFRIIHSTIKFRFSERAAKL